MNNTYINIKTNALDNVKVPTRETLKTFLSNRTIISVKDFGAKGDSTTDDTTAFKNALASDSYSIYVPQGTYNLSEELLLDDAKTLIFATEDTILNFTQTIGNAISMKMSANIRGHHGTIVVPYEFSGNVINIVSSLDDNATNVPPWTKWDPQWKTARYITDLNITKHDSRGFHYSIDGTCYGNAIYCECNENNGVSTFIWGLNFSGIRIAGAFNYGVYFKNLDSAWNHDLRCEVIMDACKIGVCLDNCNNAYIDATIQPRWSYSLSNVKGVYAEYGVLLKNSRNTDLSRTRVWDWGTETTKWTNGGIYQHIGMIGNCTGTILSDFLYWEDTQHDIRSLIYTDTASNLEKITILQEPFTRWFKPIENIPYFFDGTNNKELLLKQEYDRAFGTTKVADFTDVLHNAINKDGTIYNNIGYKKNVIVNSSTGEDSGWTNAMATGWIACKTEDVIHIQDFGWWDTTSAFIANTGVVLYDASFKKLTNVNRGNLISNAYNSATDNYTYDGGIDTQFTIKLANVAYIRMSTTVLTLGTNPVVAINEDIKYSLVGTLANTIKVDYNSLINVPEQVTVAVVDL